MSDQTSETIVGVDIGGTFTDCVVITPDGDVTIGKALSTPPEFHDGFVSAIAEAGKRKGIELGDLFEQVTGLYHGCTVGTNALVEGRTAKVGLLTTRGHRDSIFMMQAGRRLRSMPPEYIARSAEHEKPAPLVPKRLVREIDERIARDGVVLVELDEGGAREAIRELLDEGVEAFAISLLWSVRNPAHERRLAELVAEMAPDAFVSVASQVIVRTGEYERTVATVVNALVGPEMDAYLAGLSRRLEEAGYKGEIQIMTCTGGVISMPEARALPLLTIGSGPVAGVIGSGALADLTATAAGPEDVITADMGGTTLDVGVVHGGKPLTRPTSWHGQFEYYTPTLDVRSIGAGGGSIIRFNEDMGTLRVGPQSAGARPGPVCYGRGGTEATITDADLVLGYLNPEYFLGGSIDLDVDAAHAALARAGAPLGFSAEETAMAANRIVENEMADAIRLASVQQGYDPRAFSLYAYGGAGPVHAMALAEALGIRRVVIPLGDLAAGWSAFGIASSDALVVEEVASIMQYPFDPAAMNQAWSALERRVLERMLAQGIGAEEVEFERVCDLRYSLQVNQVEVAAPGGAWDEDTVAELIGSFEAEYARLFGEGTGYAEAGYTATAMRVAGRASGEDLSLRRLEEVAAAGPEPRAHRPVIFHESGSTAIETPVYDGGAIGPGQTVSGPAIVEFPDTGLVVRTGGTVSVDPHGSVVIEISGKGH